MSNHATTALEQQNSYLAGVLSNLESAKGKLLRGSMWKVVREDDSDQLRALMAQHQNYDRDKLKSLPSNRRVELHGYERRWWFGKKRTGVAIASVLTPLDHFASDAPGDAPPIPLGELTQHIRKLTADHKVDHVIGVCSPSGFTEEARRAKFDMPNVSVVLAEPTEFGGWQLTALNDATNARLVKLFDPEDAQDKITRVRSMIEERSVDLLTGGISVSGIAEKAGLSEKVVRAGFEQVAADDPELRLTKNDGQYLLYRGAPVHTQEKQSMNVIDKIKHLFAGDGDENEKINLLSERRALLAQRRDRLYEDIGQLEKREAKLLADGKAAASSVPRRRIAAQLAQLRKDIGRQNTTAAMLNQQINIISTDIHNLTLIKQGQVAQLPDTEQLTEHAVEAEEMLERLKSDSDLVGGLETGMEESVMSDEELAILKELEGDTEEAAPPAKIAASEPSPSATAFTPDLADSAVDMPTPMDESTDEPTADKTKNQADPEAM